MMFAYAGRPRPLGIPCGDGRALYGRAEDERTTRCDKKKKKLINNRRVVFCRVKARTGRPRSARPPAKRRLRDDDDDNMIILFMYAVILFMYFVCIRPCTFYASPVSRFQTRRPGYIIIIIFISNGKKKKKKVQNRLVPDDFDSCNVIRRTHRW